MSNRTRLPGTPDVHELAHQKRGAEIEPSKAVEFAQDYVRALLEKFLEEFPPKDHLPEGQEPRDPMEGTILTGLNPNDAVEIPLKEALIYIVDDDVAVSRAVKRVLGKIFSNFKIFNDGKYAFEAMFDGDQLVEVPHLLATDTNMRFMGGEELAGKLENIDAAIRPKLVAMTGAMENKNIQTYVRLGHPVIEKPLDSNNFRALVVGQLRQHPGFRPVEKK